MKRLLVTVYFRLLIINNKKLLLFLNTRITGTNNNIYEEIPNYIGR